MFGKLGTHVFYFTHVHAQTKGCVVFYFEFQRIGATNEERFFVLSQPYIQPAIDSAMEQEIETKEVLVLFKDRRRPVKFKCCDQPDDEYVIFCRL